jgi:3-methyladenine DNA glycosylase AlkC
MAEPLKGIYNKQFLHSFGETVQAAYNLFDTRSFVDEVMGEEWEALELKNRTRRISTTLGKYLPERYEEALDVLLQIYPNCKGFPFLFFPDFVEVFGQEDKHWALSMHALENFTQSSSAEFAVRTFIMREPEKMMNQMREWSKHPNEHVRRLASEGCRPRLPWGQALPMFKQNPEPIHPILEQLKADPSLYVRKSVANNLNDIAKDHPSMVLEIARKWKGNNSHTDWIVRHACRTLIRKAEPEALSLFGYTESSEEAALAVHAAISTDLTQLPIGGSSEIQYELQIREGEEARIRIEYGIYFVKSKGKTSRKLFLLSDKTVPGGSQLTGKRTHRWANLTTRRHYPGNHRLALLVNGREVAHTEIVLLEEN